jgi:hypothetical protein
MIERRDVVPVACDDRGAGQVAMRIEMEFKNNNECVVGQKVVTAAMAPK